MRAALIKAIGEPAEVLELADVLRVTTGGRPYQKSETVTPCSTD
jgi:hypothetical protein